MLDTMDKPQTVAAVVEAPSKAKAPFTIKRLKALRAPEPKLWGEADMSPVPATLLDWYWHGTPVANLESIFEHGLLPERTLNHKRTCLAARSHVAFFWGRIQTMYGAGQQDIALIRVPGAALQTPQLFIEKGTIETSPYGEQRPDILHAWKKSKWDDTNWQGFQSTFGCISTKQTLRVTPEMVVTVAAKKRHLDFKIVLEEMYKGEPPKVDPHLA